MTGSSQNNRAIGIVIPGYGHPQFLAEAIVCACEQEIDRPVKVVVVDDGCRFPETGEIVLQLMSEYPGVLHYLRQENTRLPGARNAGVRFLMTIEPELDSIYFLDADNRIAPYSLKSFRDALGDDPAIGWAYPDISMFGLSWGEDGFDIRETSPDYVALKHLAGNISEAGSLVRIEVFKAGVFYDETMTSGFEDWDFWLYALEAGFKGVRARHSGFLYRRRPESMLADSRRLEAVLISRMRTAHKGLFQPKNILSLEQAEAPIFAFYVPETQDLLLTSDPKLPPRRIPLAGFQQMVQDWLHDPREAFFPDYLIVISEAMLQSLEREGPLLRWCFWRLKEWALPAVQVSFTGADTLGMEFGTPAAISFKNRADFLCVRTAVIKRQLLAVGAAELPSDYQMETIVSALVRSPFSPISAPQDPAAAETHPDNNNSETLQAGFIELLRSWLPVERRVRHMARKYAGPSCERIRTTLVADLCAAEGRQVYPANCGKRRAMIFINNDQLSDKLALQHFKALLKQLQRLDLETLVVLEHDPVDFTLPKDTSWLPFASDIVPLPMLSGELEYRVYLGRRVSVKLGLMANEDITIFAKSCEILIACGAAAGLEALGKAKAHGAKGYVWLDPAFMGRGLAAADQFAKLLAYEHAIEAVVVDQGDAKYGLSAEGFPIAKFQAVNAFFTSLSNEKAGAVTGAGSCVTSQ